MVTRFDSFIGRTNNRKLSLSMDNASCHGNLKTISSLRNIELGHSSANTTLLLQPLDAGIISDIKHRYRKCQVMKFLHLIEQNYDSVYVMDQITATKWVQSIWIQLESTIVHNCWAKTGLIGISSTNSNLLQNTITREDHDILNYIRSILPVRQKLVLENFIQPPGEDFATTAEKHLE